MRKNRHLLHFALPGYSDCTFFLVETRNEELEIENRALLSENAQLRKTNASVQQFNVKYKTELEKEITQREQLYEANQKHKERYQLLLARFTEQSEKVKTLEHSLRAAASTRRINHVPVEIIGMDGSALTFVKVC